LRALIAILYCVCLISCAGRQLSSFRIVGDRPPILIPPGVNLGAASAQVKLSRNRLKCKAPPPPIGILQLTRKPAIAIRREQLESVPPGALSTWADSLSEAGCLPNDQALQIVSRTIDSLPLEAERRRQLLRGRGDLPCPGSIQIVSPVDPHGFKASHIAGISQAANGGSIDVALDSASLSLGVNKSWYDLTPRDDGEGCRIEFRGSEVSFDGKVVARNSPDGDLLKFDPKARWFQLFMMTKSSGNDFDHVVLAGSSHAELRKTVAEFKLHADQVLERGDVTTHIRLPPLTGINAFIRVKLNGRYVDIEPNATVRTAVKTITSAGLKLRRLHNGKLYPVLGGPPEALLSLPLEPGDEISWTTTP
jgi:hypothetical protein